MTNVIATVRLAQGRVGFFDELTRIHLTISRPEAYITSNMNTANIKRAVHQKTLRLVSGSLEPEVASVVELTNGKPVVKEEAVKAPKVVVPQEVVETTAPVAEEVVEAVEEVKEVEAKEAEEVVEKPAKKAPAKKKKAEPKEEVKPEEAPAE